VRRQCAACSSRRSIASEPIPDGFPHLLERAHLDLAHALARDAELVRQLPERDRLIGEPACLEDAPLAPVERREGLTKRLAPVAALLALEQHPLLAGRLVDQPILPFAGFALIANRRVERGIAGEPAVHG